MASLNLALTPHVSEALKAVKRLTPTERLVLARLLLDSVLTTEVEDEADWSNLGLMAFEAEWDNPEDAIYDKFRRTNERDRVCDTTSVACAGTR